ncbi:MAG: DegT/DnrJ/EryC1/StrS family aminotransferase [Candidatus Berkelbacteria bacterium]|nr:DegT/DnrJ/EryC1/StrS family aminotransferase [Candidatus Berkelbacteria bacterium]
MINISKPYIGPEEIDAVVKVLKSGQVVQGPVTAKLEEKFAKYCGCKYAVAFNSGTAALHAGLYAFGVEAGGEVITTPFTFVATANPILMQGARVVFADVSEKDFNIDPEEVIKKINKKTKAIIPVDLYGQIYNFKALKKIARDNDLKILEDACQAVGAEQDGKRAGNFGDAAAFSLYATKNIMSAEGGMLTTNNAEIYKKSKMFRHHGQSEERRYEYLDLGYNYRTTDICAAIGLEQLKRADKFNKQRIKNASALTKGLARIPGIILPQVKAGSVHVFHQYTIRVTDEYGQSRDELIEFLKKKGIGCGIYYPKSLHLHSHFQKQGYKKGDFPVAEKLAGQVLSLPVHPGVGAEDIKQIIAAIKLNKK